MTMRAFCLACLALAMLGGGCDTNSDGTGDCSAASDCTGDPSAGCDWACIDGKCEKLCTGECATAADCEGLEWPIDCEGYWECRNEECEAVCDEHGCDVAGDCAGLPWELQCPGHWECVDGECEAVCDQACWSAADCVDELPCEYGGRWTCPDGECVPECSGQPECQVPEDCIEMPWPEDCFGHWECLDRLCVPVCDGNDCVPEGLPAAPDIFIYCCEGLIPADDCLPDEACAGVTFCVDCFDWSCDPHENQFNCPQDCPNGCFPGEEVWFECPEGDHVPWCRCFEEPCPPVCVSMGGNSDAWVDSCTGNLIRQVECRNCEVVCDQVGSWEEEGWYAFCDSGSVVDVEPIVLGACAPRWDCDIDPLAMCLGR